MKIDILPYTLQFKFLAGTSRGTLKEHKVWYVKIEHEDDVAWGEIAPLKGLSPDLRKGFEQKINEVKNELLAKDNLKNIDLEDCLSGLDEWPAIKFGFETALIDLKKGAKQLLFDTSFTRGEEGIPINGLIWMGDRDFMMKQVREKLDKGFHCIKIKIGAINFETECEIIRYMRSKFSKETLTIRVDANGAFDYKSAYEKLSILSGFDIHSIEQPIQAGQIEQMADLCKKTPLPVALDEELISVPLSQSESLLESISPQYIILKPTLVGGFKNTAEWIENAKKLEIGWWVTSALESNIGLSAISQFTSTYSPAIYQGLGTGQLYHNNIPSPLIIRGEELWNTGDNWSFDLIS